MIAAFTQVAESARIELTVSFRLRHLLALIAVIAVGMWFRFSAPFPPWLRDATGAAPYVVCWALVFAICSGRPRPWAYSNWAFLLTAALEFAQLWHPPWLLAIRGTFPGRLMLGTTFSWWDFPAYFAGLLLAVVTLRSLGGAESRGRAPHRRPRKGSRG